MVTIITAESTKRVNFLLLAKERIYMKISVIVGGLSKSTNTLIVLLIQIVDKLQKLNPEVRIVKYKVELKKSNTGYGVELSLVMKEVPTFIKYIKEFFHKVRTKGKEGGRVYIRCLILHNLLIEDLIDLVKEEMSEIRLFMKP